MSETLVVTSSVAPLKAEPRVRSEQVTQVLAGHRLETIERAAPWIRVRALLDGYEGWMHEGYIATLAAREHGRRWSLGRVSLGCTVTEIDGRRRALPLGAILPDDTFVESGSALTPAQMIARFPRTPIAITRSAQHYFEGAPYEWGGVTPWGADCSGFVQTTLALHGMRVPRDARDQATLGAPVESLDRLHAADLLFFSDRDDGAITHVALALDGERFVHLALGRGGYSVERMNPVSDPYVRALMERFRQARRLEL